MRKIADWLPKLGLRRYAHHFIKNDTVIYVFTHDSIGVGEDGPTHQPVEQLAALRQAHRP